MEGGGLVHHIPIQWAGMELFLDTVVMTWVTMAVLIIFTWAAVRHLQMVPSGSQNVLEAMIEYMQDLAESMLGPEGKKMAPYFFTLFFFIMLANMWGLIPFLTSPTNDLNTTFGIALVSVLGVYVLGVYRKGWGYFKHFLHPMWFMLPLNILDELVRPFTLAIRLFVNILVGEVLLMVLYNLFPPLVPVAWLLMSVLIGVIQAFVFTLLSASYYAEAFSRDEH